MRYLYVWKENYPHTRWRGGELSLLMPIAGVVHVFKIKRRLM